MHSLNLCFPIKCSWNMIILSLFFYLSKFLLFSVMGKTHCSAWKVMKTTAGKIAFCNHCTTRILFCQFSSHLSSQPCYWELLPQQQSILHSEESAQQGSFSYLFSTSLLLFYEENWNNCGSSNLKEDIISCVWHLFSMYIAMACQLSVFWRN